MSTRAMIVSVIILFILIVTFYFIFLKNPYIEKSNIDNLEDKKTVNNTILNPTTSDKVFGSNIGKSIYANSNGVKKLYKSSGQTYKTLTKNEFAGVVFGETTLGGSPFYETENGGMVIAKNLVHF